MFKLWCFLIAILILNEVSLIAAFNLDVVNYIQHDGQDDSMFGFSVALHKEKEISWLVFII